MKPLVNFLVILLFVSQSSLLTQSSPVDDDVQDNDAQTKIDEPDTKTNEFLPIKTVTCARGIFAWMKCWNDCLSSKAYPNCCNYDGPVFRCNCYKSVGGGGFSDFNPYSLYTRVKTNVGCIGSNWVKFGQEVLPHEKSVEIIGDDEPEPEP